MRTKPYYLEPKLYVELCDFLNDIANSVGDNITEYHWREACGLLLEIEDADQAERRRKLMMIENLESINSDDQFDVFNI